MIFKGGSVSTYRKHAKHLQKSKKRRDGRDCPDGNDEVDLVCTHNIFCGESIDAAFKEMAAVASGAQKCRNWLYSVAMSPGAAGERELSVSEAEYAASELLRELGFSDDHQWLLVRHRKNQRNHFHIEINRVHPTLQKAHNLGHNYVKHEIVARRLEAHFQLRPVPGVFTGRRKDPDGRYVNPRPRAAYSTAEIQQANASGIDVRRVERDVQRAWAKATSGEELQSLLFERGYVLAHGDRRSCVLIDWSGKAHSLSRRLRSVTAQRMNGHLAELGIDLQALPSVSERRELLDKVKNEAAFEAEMLPMVMNADGNISEMSDQGKVQP